MGRTEFRKTDLIDEVRSQGHPELKSYIDSIIRTSVNELKKAYFPSDHDTMRLWQCNVNLYKKTDDLYWHRDDRTKKISLSENQHWFVPLTNTFYPVSATYILSEIGDVNVGLSVAMPLLTTACRPDQNGDIILGDPQAIEETFNNEGNPTTLVILMGNAYTHGIHCYNPKWRERDDSKRRISFNFRLVRESCWKTVCPEGSSEQNLL